jgi:hypothetical protein
LPAACPAAPLLLLLLLLLALPPLLERLLLLLELLLLPPLLLERLPLELLWLPLLPLDEGMEEGLGMELDGMLELEDVCCSKQPPRLKARQAPHNARDA